MDSRPIASLLALGIAEPKPEKGLFSLLLEASDEADAAERELDSAREEFQRSPSAEKLERIRQTSAKALEQEVRFEDLWRSVAETLFSETPKRLRP
jgi:hypothetical protein